ncbi:hypothetical protein DFS34DRAFT_642108 [Phlyctochytrium arcticum]|nr:hypothetical protein DFS34DRAFT_642108 [Phlyctochytrium arcticum]
MDHHPKRARSQRTAPDFDLAAGFKNQIPGRNIKKNPGLDLVLYKPFIARPTSRHLYKYLLGCLPWHRVQYSTRGINITTPRYTTVFGCDETGAVKESYHRRPRELPVILLNLKAEVEKRTGAHFNFVLLNFYAGGSDSISYHSDDETFLGPNPTIASLSLGGTRDFLMKHKKEKSRTEKFMLEDGDLLLMRGETQTQWLHAVPKRATAQPRINITFRKAINVHATNNYYRYNVGDGGVLRFVDGKMVAASAAGKDGMDADKCSSSHNNEKDPVE